MKNFTHRLFLTLSMFVFFGISQSAFGQPTVFGSQIVNGSYSTYDLVNRGGARFVRLQATTAAASGSRNWEFATGTAGATNYSINWRPYTTSQTLSGYNTYIDPASAAASARYNTSSGGQSGLLPAVVANTYYTVNVGGNNAANNFMSILSTAYNPKDITAASQSPVAASVLAGQPVTVSITTSASLSADEFAYVRYSTDDFVTSALALVAMTGTSGTATIPATTNSAGANVVYYVFTSNQSSITASQSDFFTLNLFNSSGQNVSGGGTNYSYTVGAIPTYTWNQTGTASWITASNWTPNRSIPGVLDNLVFNNAATTTVTNMPPTQTIGGLLISNNTNVTFGTTTAAALTISNGVSGNDLSVAAGSSLNVLSNAVQSINVATGAVGSIGGSMNFAGTSGSNDHLFTASDASGITFTSGALFTQNLFCTGNVFGSGTNNSIVFTNGATFNHSAGSNPFANSQPASVVVFNTNSNYINNQLNGNEFSFSGRTYGNVTFSGTGTCTGSGTAGLSINNLAVNSGVLNLNMTTIAPNIRGNITVANGATLTFTPGSATAINLNSGGVQTITNNGTLSVGGSGNLTVVSGTTVDLGTSVITGGGAFTAASGATFRTGNTGGIASSGATGSIQTTTRNFDAGGNYVYNGVANQITGTGLPATVNTLTINNTGVSPNNIVTLTAIGASTGTTNSLSLVAGRFDMNTRQYTIPNNGSVVSTGGDFNATAGPLFFLGNGNATGTINFPTVRLGSSTTGVAFSAGSNIVTSLTLEASSFLTTAPTYANTSTLIYNMGGTYNRNVEFGAASGNGCPHNVLIQNNTTLNMTVNAAASRRATGNLTITTGSTLSIPALTVGNGGDIGVEFLGDIINDGTISLNTGTNTTNQRLKGANLINGNSNSTATINLSGAFGGDLELTGNYVDNAVFTANSRGVFFTGTGTQTISGTASAPFNIDYMVITKASGIVQLGVNLLTGAPAAGNGLTLTNATSILDLNGNAFTLGTAGVANSITGSGFIRGSATSALNILGTGTLGTINFESGNRLLGTLAIDRTSSGLVTLGSDLDVRTAVSVTNGTLNLGNNTLTVSSGTANTIAGVLAGTGNIIKTGSGILTLTNPTNSFTGTTTITAGELRLNPTANATYASQMVLDGGKLSTTGIAAATTFTSYSTLQLAADSSIDLGTAAHELRFADSNAVTWAGTFLTINGWTGTGGNTGTAGKLFFGTATGTLTPTQRTKTTFTTYSGTPLLLGTGELVPQAANTDFTWNGSTSNDWDNPLNWTPTGVPTAADNVIINIPGASTNCNIPTGNKTVTNFTLNGTGILAMAANTSLTVNGNITHGGTAILTAECSSTFNIASATAQTVPALNYGNLNVSNGDRTFANTGIIGVCGSFTRGAGAFTITGSTVNFNGTGAQTITAGTYNNLTISNARLAAALTSPTGTINVSGTFDVSTLSNYTPAVNAASIFDFTAATAQTIPAFFYGQINNSGNGARTWASSGIIDVAQNFSSGAGTHTITGSTFRYSNSSGTINLPAITTNVTDRQYNNLILNGGAAANWSVNGGTLGVNGNLNITSGSLIVGTTSAGIANIDGNLAIDGANGILNVSNGSAAGTVNLLGNFSQSNGAFSKTGSGTGTFNFIKASGTQTLSQTGGTINNNGTIWNLGNGTSTNTVQLATGIVINAGSVIANNAASVDFQTFVLSGTTTFTTAAGTTLISANASGINSTGATGSVQCTTRPLNVSGISLTYNGIVAQVTGDVVNSVINSGRSLLNLRINNSNNVTLSGSGNAQNAAKVTGTLFLTNGVLILDSRDLELTSTATISGTFSSTAMIATLPGLGLTTASGYRGRLLKSFSSGSGSGLSFLYPLGDITGTAQYTPINITSLSYATAGTPFIAFKVIDAKSPFDSSIDNFLTRFYEVTTGNSFSGATGISLNFTAAYITGAEDVVGNDNLFKMSRFSYTNGSMTDDASSNCTTGLITSATLTNQMDFNQHDISARLLAPTYFRSAVSSGSWETAANWIASTDVNFMSPVGVTPSVAPISSNSAGIRIMNTHNITTTTLASAFGLPMDDTIIDAGGTVIIPSTSVLNIQNGIGTDLIVNGTLINQSPVAPIRAAGSIVEFSSTGLYNHNLNGGTIPASTWSNGSECRINGTTTTLPLALNQAFSKFSWNATNQSVNLNLAGLMVSPGAITSDFSVQSTNTSTLTLDDASNSTFTVGGNLNVTGGNIAISQTNSVLSLVGVINNSGGTITFQNTTSLLQTSTSANTGNIRYFRTTRTNQPQFSFTYWGSPVAGQTLGPLWMSSSSADTFYSWTGNPGVWTFETAATTMTLGKGYIARARIGGSGTDFLGTRTYDPLIGWTARFNGVPNNGDVSINVVGAGGFTDNLLANPYPSAIDINLFRNDNIVQLTGNFYFWTSNTPINSNNQYVAADYAIWNTTLNSGVGGVPSGSASPTPDKFVDAGQGFFAEGLANGTVTFKNAHRVAVAGSNNAFYRTNLNNNNTESTLESSKIWLNVTNSQGLFKQQLLTYTTGATNGYDPTLDAKTYDGNVFADFYSHVAGAKYAIQSRALPFVTTDLVPLGFKTTVAGAYTIAIDHFDGLFANQTVYLQDNLLNIDHNLTSSPYNFNTTTGTFNNRFVLKYTSTMLNTNNPNLSDNTLIVSNTYNLLKIKSSTENISKVVVYDLLGRIIFEKDKINETTFETRNITLNQQALIVKIVLESGVVETRKVVF